MKLRAFRHVVQFGLCRNWTFFPGLFARRTAVAFPFAFAAGMLSSPSSNAARADPPRWPSDRFRQTSIARSRPLANEAKRLRRGCAYRDGKIARHCPLARTPPNFPEPRAAESAWSLQYAPCHTPISLERPQTGCSRVPRGDPSLRAVQFRCWPADRQSSVSEVRRRGKCVLFHAQAFHAARTQLICVFLAPRW